MAKQRTHRFLVGYKKDGAVVFGKYKNDCFTSAIPLTLFQAKREVKRMMQADGVIFKLVEVKD